MVGSIFINYERKRKREQSLSSYFLLHLHSIFRLVHDARFWKMDILPSPFGGRVGDGGFKHPKKHQTNSLNN
jgi:hypothetical protein